ncbi:hypothetical protein MMYC01_205953 [Madurella mycetomatis]|uniref:Magnesium transport protein CorA n=1 Tax=Madurella mycetomatis TaxID=100816 RepID=A0A175W2D5_9PEZI|nr:hypothetical protein MMYC01_205953 [Madurella mycetomatis]
MSTTTQDSGTGGSQDAPVANIQAMADSSAQPPDDASHVVPPISVADLLRELQETNRLLRAMVLAQQEPASGQAVEVAPSPASGSGQAQLHSTSASAAVKEKARQLVDEFARAAFGPGKPNLEVYRDQIVEVMLSHLPWGGQNDTQEDTWAKIMPMASEQVPLVVSLTRASKPSVLLWHRRTPHSKVPLTGQEITLLNQQWPLRFELDRLIHKTSRYSGWILGNNPGRDGALCATPLIYGPGQKLLPASAILDTSQKTNLVAERISASDLRSPGSLWHFTTPIWADRVMPLDRLALITAVSMKRHNDDWDTVHDFLQEFCAGWRPRHLRGKAREFGGWTGNSEIAYQHTIRCFSPNKNCDTNFVPYVRCHRETGNFPCLPGVSPRAFVEQRMSVVCRWSYHEEPQGFMVMILGDFQTVRVETQETNDLFTDWEDRHFTVRGGNAGYHVLQSAMHRMLMYWEKEWSHCLDELESSVNTKLHDILSDESSSNLMFDTSFVRSRLYFKTLEMLRIFADNIRETGRDLQEMDPERLLQGSFRHAGYDVRYFLKDDPAQDKALWENWEILSNFQQKAEDGLLRRIAEKTEEIKSLRDGLFNATSLREASMATTMNRYVIVFTIMTVLYLPPSFTASLFGTPLFEAEEQAETVNRFKISTIIVCVITYVLSFLLIWLADRWDIAGAVYREMRSAWRESWARYKRRRVLDTGGESGEKLQGSSDDVRMSV